MQHSRLPRFGIVAIVASLIGCGSAAKPLAKPAAPATSSQPAAAQECETDADCAAGKHCVVEQLRDDPGAYDPNSTDGPDSAPVVEERYFCE